MSKRHKRKRTKMPIAPRLTMSEILNAEPAVMIAWFDTFDGHNPFSFLSNFHEDEPIELPVYWADLYPEADVALLGIDPWSVISGPTGEHLFAAWKTLDLEVFAAILHAKNPGTAKAWGRRRQLPGGGPLMREDWEQIKYDVMAMVLEAKFTLDRKEGQLLLNTGDALLIEGTFWGDKVWGVDLPEWRAVTTQTPLISPGRNWLGSLLMKRRAELRAEELFGVASLERLWSVANFSR